MARSKERDHWETPPDFWAWVRRIYAPTLDICATEANAKCARFVTSAMDSLANPWRQFCGPHPEVIWCNPGYSDLGPWVERAIEARDDGHGVLLLTHDNWSAAWFKRLYGSGFQAFLLSPRIKFVPPPGVEASSPARCNILWATSFYKPSNICFYEWKGDGE